MKLSVCCFLWDDPWSPRRNIYIYNADHVHTLKRMVERHLSIPHEFLCVTDRYIEGIKCVPLDMTMHIPGTRYAKLMLFRPDGKLAGRRVLYLDLDTVIVNAVDPIVDRNEDLVLWRNPNFGVPGRAFYNTSMILHTCGSRPEFWADFDRNRTPHMLRQNWGGTDQAWVSHRASREEAHWTSDHGVYGAGRLGDIVPGAGTVLPDNARIVFFPGRREPHMPEVQKIHPWIKEHLCTT